MHSVKNLMFGNRRRAVISAFFVMIVLPVGAAAAWAIFSGGQGQGNGKFASASTSAAVVLTQASGGSASATCYPGVGGGTCDLRAFTRNDSGVAQHITGGTGTFTSVPASCASHLSVRASGLDLVVAANDAGLSPNILSGLILVDSTLPDACSDGSFVADVSLNTHP